MIIGCIAKHNVKYHSYCTFPPPVSLGSKSNVSSIFAVKLCHESFVGVSDHKDARVEGFNLFLATLMCLNADSPSTPPVVSLSFKSCEMMTHNKHLTLKMWVNMHFVIMSDKC